MTDKPTHTPLPWEAQVLETENDPGVYIVGSNLGGLVCAALPWPTEIESGDYSRVEANAAFIVHAVNSHHDLIKALTDVGASLAAAISLLERGGKAAKKAAPSDRMFDQMVKDYRASLNRTRAILTKAEAGHG